MNQDTVDALLDHVKALSSDYEIEKLVFEKTHEIISFELIALRKPSSPCAA